MHAYPSRKRRKSISALIFLTLIGVGFLVFALVAITCAFVINYHDDFDATDKGNDLEAKLDSEFDYSQYWIGIPFLITSILSIVSGTMQRHRALNAITLALFHICIVLGLFAIVLEGPDWVYWKNLDRMRNIWEDKDFMECSSTGATCSCTNVTSGANTPIISPIASCSNIRTLSGLFGGIVASAIVGIVLSLAGIVIMLKSISWKPRHRSIEYDLQKVRPVQYHESSYRNKAYANGIPHMAGAGMSERQVPTTMYGTRDLH